MTTSQPSTRRHQALSAQSRVDLLEALRRAERPLTVTEAAAAVGLHPNTARVHLERLVEVGLAERRPEDRDQPGRPRTLYAAADVAEEPAAEDEEDYKTLAALLARELGASPGARRAAIDAGHRWAEERDRHTPEVVASDPDAGEVIDGVVRIMDGLGFRPSYDPEGNEILLRRCPFEDVARESRSVVCGVHLGLIEGTVDQLGGGVRVRRLEPFREDEPLLCAVRLEKPTTNEDE